MPYYQRTSEPKCEDCGGTPSSIARKHPERVNRVSRDQHSGRILCNECWSRITPTWTNRTRGH